VRKVGYTDYSRQYRRYSNRRGAFGNNGAAKFRDISDGLSNSTLFGESWSGDRYKCSGSYGPFGLSGIHTAVHGRVVSGSNYGAYSRARWQSWGRDWGINANYKAYDPSHWCQRARRRRGLQRIAYAWQFNSGHPGGAQFAFADGAVHFLSQTMSYKIFCFMNYIADRQSYQAVL